MISLGNITTYYMKMPYNPKKQAFNGGLKFCKLCFLTQTSVQQWLVDISLDSNSLKLLFSNCVSIQFSTYYILRSTNNFSLTIILNYLLQTQSVTSCATKDRTFPNSRLSNNSNYFSILRKEHNFHKFLILMNAIVFLKKSLLSPYF